MSINVSQAFHRTSANPVDESMALTKAQMKTVNDNLMPAYYFTICQDDGSIYLYDKSATASAETGKFKKFEGGGGSGGGSTLVINKTLTVAGWNNKQQSLTFTGYDSDLGGVIGMPTNATAAQKEAYKNAEINVTAQNGAVFTFSCKDVPEIDLPVTLYAGGGSGSGGGGTADFPSGGTTGQALVKASDADNDVEWRDVSGEQVQYDTMPAPSADNLGQIVQYTGETTITAPIYTNGLFYECVSNGAATPVYSWKQKDVQSYPEADLDNVFTSGFPTASVSGGSNPVGTIISFFGLNAPDGYLKCDGATYNRADYPTLAQHLTSQFSDLVGDGSTTFKVPDLRGEFLRGTGTNSHENQGNGANVGVHQDATEIPNIGYWHSKDATTPYMYLAGVNDKSTAPSENVNILSTKYEKTINERNTGLTAKISVDSTYSANNAELFLPRPTNTSVLYCIKY